MTLVSLPSVLKRRVTSFLDPRSAIALSRTCHKMHSALNLMPLEPRFRLSRETFAVEEPNFGHVPVKSLQIPIFFQNHSHSILLKGRWRDQGFGSRKGRIYLVEHHDDDDADAPFEGGKVIYKSVAPHQLQPLEITFAPKRTKGNSDKKPPKYHLWLVVGGGGGRSRNELVLENLYVHTLVFDDAGRTMSKAYTSLKKLRVLPKRNKGYGCDSEDTDSVTFEHSVNDRKNCIFCAKLLRSLAQTLLQVPNSTHDESTLKVFFNKYQLQTDSRALSEVTSVCDFLLTFLCHHVPEESIESTSGKPTPKRRKVTTAAKEMALPKFILGQNLEEDDYGKTPATRIPFLYGKTEKAKLNIDWEGPSDRKLYLVARPIEQRECHQKSFSERGRIVWESPTLPGEVHMTQRDFDIEFSPRDDERYILYCAMPSSFSSSCKSDSSSNSSSSSSESSGELGLFGGTVREISVQLIVSALEKSSTLESCFSRLLLDGGLLDVKSFFSRPFMYDVHVMYNVHEEEFESECNYSFLLDMVKTSTDFLIQNCHLHASPLHALFRKLNKSLDESFWRYLAELVVVVVCHNLENDKPLISSNAELLNAINNGTVVGDDIIDMHVNLQKRAKRHDGTPSCLVVTHGVCRNPSDGMVYCKHKSSSNVTISLPVGAAVVLARNLMRARQGRVGEPPPREWIQDTSASQICWNKRCIHPEHVCEETDIVSSSRILCLAYSDRQCLHEPKCILERDNL